jgi:hypothetical protein
VAALAVGVSLQIRLTTDDRLPESPRFAQVSLGAGEARYVDRIRVRMLLNLAPVILNSACVAGHTGVALAFAETFRLQAGIVHG